MSKVRIVTDSTADIPPALAAELEITVVPLKVLFGEEAFRDGIDLTMEQFYARLAKEKSTTSQPSPGDFFEAYSELTANGDSVISLHISAALSGTMQSAQIARSMLTDRHIDTIDTHLTSIPLAMIALEAARRAQSGASHENVVDLIQRMMPLTEVYFMVDTLEYLQRGGRIGKAQALVGTLLNLKPVLHLKEGIVQPYERVRGRQKALDVLVRSAVAAAEKHGRLVCATLQGDVPEILSQLNDKLEAQLGYGPVISCRIGTVIGTHTGPGVVGVAFYPANVLDN